jgi:hypothetical protein
MMRWHSLRGRFPECPDRPYLLDGDVRQRAEDLSSLGFESVFVEVAACATEKDIAREIGKALGFPDTFRGGWDAFIDLLPEGVVEAGRIVAVEIVDADELARRNIRLFVRLVWMLMNATDAVEVGGAGDAQLEFLFGEGWSSCSR